MKIPRTFEEWWDTCANTTTPETYKGWEESCRQAWAAGERREKLASGVLVGKLNRLQAEVDRLRPLNKKLTEQVQMLTT